MWAIKADVCKLKVKTCASKVCADAGNQGRRVQARCVQTRVIKVKTCASKVCAYAVDHGEDVCKQGVCRRGRSR
jgi:hypothetical protein